MFQNRYLGTRISRQEELCKQMNKQMNERINKQLQAEVDIQ